MESPKLATDNRFKKLIKSYLWNRTMLNFCVLWWPFWKWRPVEIFRCRESIQDVEIEQCWICAVLWWPLWKWRPLEIFWCQESIRDIIIYPHMKCHWNRTMLNLCGIVVAILNMATGRNFSMSGIIRDIIIYPHMKWCWNRTMLNLCVLWRPFWKWRPVEIFQCQESIRDIIIYPHIKFWWYRTMLNFYHIFFYAVFWQPFWKWQTSRKFWKRRIAPLMVTYHYFKFYVSIIIYLEVININVRNFNFPIGFYSIPHPLW
jgi:hypothetical protein